MESLVNRDFWRDRSVFITGHTGFKGSWLSLWLQSMGAQVTGFALPPPTIPSLYQEARIEEGMINSVIADIRDYDALSHAIQASSPEVVIHLAAQPLVGEGYRDPINTFSTNVMGTVNLLEAARNVKTIRAIVVVTTDKCYENLEWDWPYREIDNLGGHDPYSSSKACAELVSAAYRRSFLSDQGIQLATARAGNVIGGGDWAKDRLLPDLVHAFTQGVPATIRRPGTIRPWQHVLEPLSGYLLLAEKLCSDHAISEAWNFGPEADDCLTTGELANRACAIWGQGASWQAENTDFPHEAGILRLDASRARHRLGWKPRWDIDMALRETISWAKARAQGEDVREITLRQILAYSNILERTQ